MATTSSKECPSCKGKTTVPCPACSRAEKRAINDDAVEITNCASCHGQRRVRCRRCAGTGVVSEDR
jgi:hypothetical protein